MTPRHSHRLLPQAGFTLLEILVVLVFVALLVSMAATGLRIFNAGRSPETQANRFAALLQLASDEAVLTGTEVGLLMDSRDMQFFRFQPATREWVSLSKDEQFFDREIPDGITMQLELEGLAVNNFQLDPGDEALQDSPAPQLIFFSSGEATAFTLRFTGEPDQPAWQLVGNILGQFDISESR